MNEIFPVMKRRPKASVAELGVISAIKLWGYRNRNALKIARRSGALPFLLLASETDPTPGSQLDDRHQADDKPALRRRTRLKRREPI